MKEVNIDDHKEKVKLDVNQSLSSTDSLLEYGAMILNNFAYRFMQTTLDPEAQASIVSPQRVEVRSREDELMEALKCTHPEVKKGVMEMAKREKKKKGPTVEYVMGLEFHNITPQGGGECLVETSVNWDTPSHKDPSLQVERKKKLKFSEPIELRNNLARYIEESCDVFD